ncbi:MAG: hypothetical protein J6M17_09525 [Ruminococcus sp.]|nr:hypothetical protein [Ruminococcus sp.]
MKRNNNDNSILSAVIFGIIAASNGYVFIVLLGLAFLVGYVALVLAIIILPILIICSIKKDANEKRLRKEAEEKERLRQEDNAFRHFNLEYLKNEK